VLIINITYCGLTFPAACLILSLITARRNTSQVYIGLISSYDVVGVTLEPDQGSFVWGSECVYVLLFIVYKYVCFHLKCRLASVDCGTSYTWSVVRMLCLRSL